MTPLVLLPGIRGDKREMEGLAAALNGHSVDPHSVDLHTVDLHAVDLYSLDLPSLTTRGSTLADHAAALADHLPAGPCVFVAASFGALVVRALPPARVARLIAIGALPLPSAAQRRCRALGPMVRRLPRPIYTKLYGARARRDWLTDEPDPRRYDTLRLPPPAALAARLDAIGRWGLPARVHTRTVWLWGAADPYARWSHADVLAIGAAPVVLPGGHRPHLSHPWSVAEWVRSG